MIAKRGLDSSHAVNFEVVDDEVIKAVANEGIVVVVVSVVAIILEAVEVVFAALAKVATHP